MIVRLSYCGLTTTDSSPAGNGERFQTTITHHELVNGNWISYVEYVNAGLTDFRRRDPERRYQAEFMDGTVEFVSRTVFNFLAKENGLPLVGK